MHTRRLSLDRQWAQWIRLGAVTVLTPLEATELPADAAILGSRFVLTDKDKLLRVVA